MLPAGPETDFLQTLVSHIPTRLLATTVLDLLRYAGFCTHRGDWPEPLEIRPQAGNTAQCSHYDNTKLILLCKVTALQKSF